jgi:hypothetical protein
MNDNENDPLGLNVNFEDVSTAMPVLVEGVYIAQIDSMTVVENAKKTGNNLLVVFKTMAPATSVHGMAEGKQDDIAAGFPLRQYFPLQANPDKPDAPDFRKNLAMLQDAVHGTDDKTRDPVFRPSTLMKQLVALRVGVVDDDQYGKQNNIKRVSQRPA